MDAETAAATLLGHAALLASVLRPLRASVRCFADGRPSQPDRADPRRELLCFWALVGLLWTADDCLSWLLRPGLGPTYIWLLATVITALQLPAGGCCVAARVTDAALHVNAELIDRVRPRVELLRRDVETTAQKLTQKVVALTGYSLDSPAVE
eukprot:TRINITY_DN27100_c0_g3_i1.p1 TRINITY_DN27100_c0_g3~~TRINITY_DN27100_c0_g3_i1.p1  ORF type:complete len:178 (+),score=58.64 TRINITY_DN27100_c0_g3_i1:76-534(+)